MLKVGPPFYATLSIALTNAPPATAIPVIINGFMVGANLTAKGSGYVTPPAVLFSDSSGHGAAAYTQLGNGSVTNIVITSAGSGYSSNAVITISTPPSLAVVILSAKDLLVGQNYQLQIANDLNQWTNYGTPFPALQSYWMPSNYWETADTNRVFFRLQME
jgi:hypothetical protein